MKTLLFGFLTIASKLLLTLSCLWFVIEFAMTIIKDNHTFNWNTVFAVIISFILLLVSLFGYLIGGIKSDKTTIKSSSTIKKRSMFQERLDAMKNQQENARKNK